MMRDESVKRENIRELAEVQMLLDRANEYGLQAEVVWSYAQYIKAGDTHSEAVRCALYDWDLL